MPGSGLFQDYMLSLATDGSPDGSADYLLTYDTSGSALKKTLINSLPATGSGIPTDGWIAPGDTWTYASADGPTGVFTITGVDRTSILQAGMRVKYTQTTAKYGIITSGSFGGGNTTIKIYGGTDYTLANAAITSPFYSPVKAPFGFNCDPDKWTVVVTDTTDAIQSSPTASTWYNLGSISISIPIGCWRVLYEVQMETNKGSATVIDQYATLSTANNSESDTSMTSYSIFVGSSGALARAELHVHRERFLTLTSKTTYYLNSETTQTGTTDINFRGDRNTPTVIRAICGYL